MLVLPEGVTREDIVDTHKLYSYLKEQASDWYQFLNSYSDVPLLEPKVNSTLFVVTGTDKAKTWNIVQFPPIRSQLSRQTIFHYRQDQGSRSWEPKYDVHLNWSDEMSSNAEGKVPCTLFLRGISIALSKAEWTHGIVPIPTSNIPIYFIPSVPANGRRAKLERFIQRLRRGPFDDDIRNQEVRMALETFPKYKLTTVAARPCSIQPSFSHRYYLKLLVTVLTVPFRILIIYFCRTQWQILR